MQGQGIQVDRFELSRRGLKLWYRCDAGTVSAIYDAFATAALLEQIGLIEAYDTDGKEPVVLCRSSCREGHEFRLWMDFVEGFSCGIQEALKLAQHHYTKYHAFTLSNELQTKHPQGFDNSSFTNHLSTLHYLQL